MLPEWRQEAEPIESATATPECRSAPLRSASNRLALDRLAPLRSAPLRSAKGSATKSMVSPFQELPIAPKVGPLELVTKALTGTETKCKNVLENTVGALPRKMILVRLVHSPNAYSSMLVTPLGIVMVVRP